MCCNKELACAAPPGCACASLKLDNAIAVDYELVS